MRCRELDNLMDAYLDRELDPASAAGVELHLNECDRCRQEWGGLVALLMDPLPVEMPAGLSSRIMAGVEEKFAEDSVTLSIGERAVDGNSVRWMRWYRFSGAAAACIAFFAFGWLVSGWWSASHPAMVERAPANQPVAVMVSPWMMSSWVQAAAMPCPISPAMLLGQGVAPEMMIAPASISEPPTRVRRHMQKLPTDQQPAGLPPEQELPVLPVMTRFIGA